MKKKKRLAPLREYRVENANFPLQDWLVKNPDILHKTSTFCYRECGNLMYIALLTLTSLSFIVFCRFLSQLRSLIYDRQLGRVDQNVFKNSATKLIVRKSRRAGIELSSSNLVRGLFFFSDPKYLFRHPFAPARQAGSSLPSPISLPSS